MLKASNRGETVKLNKTARSAVVAALAGASLVVASSSADAAGLFDFLFGGGQRQAPQYQPQYQPSYGAPLDVRVNPKRRKHQGVAKARPTRERTTKVVNKAINPKDHPNWYLEDTTLRRGDIVVLPTGVMVYQGGPKPQTREDFSKLSDSRLVSKKERERILQMAGPPTVTAEQDSPAKGKEATAATNPVQ